MAAARSVGTSGPTVSAWRPRVPGVVEVFHARFTEYPYPMHVPDAWTLLTEDSGAVRHDADRHHHVTPHDTVSLLPPHGPHNGSPATPAGLRQRALHLDAPHLPVSLLPPHVPRHGSPATPDGCRKRVLYLDGTHLGDDLIGPAVDGPDLRAPLLRRRVGQVHTALARPGDELEAESRLTFV